jgi:hypothetical protein
MNQEKNIVDKNMVVLGVNIKNTEPHTIYLGTGENIIKITKDSFYYKGEKVDDVHNVYERFNEWLNNAQ